MPQADITMYFFFIDNFYFWFLILYTAFTLFFLLHFFNIGKLRSVKAFIVLTSKFHLKFASCINTIKY
jgi:hypothetical protein